MKTQPTQHCREERIRVDKFSRYLDFLDAGEYNQKLKKKKKESRFAKFIHKLTYSFMGEPYGR